MQTNLMCPTGQRTKLKQSVILKRLNGFVFADRLTAFALTHNRHLLTMPRITANCGLYAARWSWRSAVHQRKIRLFDFSQTELILQPAMGLIVFRKNDQA